MSVVLIPRYVKLPNWLPLSSTDGLQVGRNLKALLSIHPSNQRLERLEREYDHHMERVYRRAR